MFGRPETKNKPTTLLVASKPELPVVTPIPGLGVTTLKEVTTMNEPSGSPDISIHPSSGHNALIIEVSPRDLEDAITTVKSLSEAGLSPEKSTLQALIQNNQRVDGSFTPRRTKLPREISLALIYRSGLNNPRLLNNNNRPAEKQILSTKRMVVFIEELEQSDQNNASLPDISSPAQLPAVLQSREHETIIKLVGEELSLPDSLISAIQRQEFDLENGVAVNTQLNPDQYRRLMKFAERFNFWMILEKPIPVPPAFHNEFQNAPASILDPTIGSANSTIEPGEWIPLGPVNPADIGKN